MPSHEIGLAELAGAGGWYDSAISTRVPEHVMIPLGEDSEPGPPPGPAPGLL